jgi:hypothetical protein
VPISARERWHVSDFPERLDANAVRRHAKAEGIDLATLKAIEVRSADLAPERVDLSVEADRLCGWRLRLLCPACSSRMVHLYATRAGVRCRRCAGIANAAELAGHRMGIDLR